MNKKTKSMLSRALHKIDIFGLYEEFLRKRQKSYTYADNELLESAECIKYAWSSSKTKPVIGLVKDFNDKFPYWPKYYRFLEKNGFLTVFIDVNSCKILEEIRKIDILVWRISSDPFELEKSKNQIYFFEKICNIFTYPSYEELWFYENKINQHLLYQRNKIPHIKTFVSYDYDETKKFLSSTRFPIVSKLNTASGSLGVSLLERKKAVRLINRVFYKGQKTPYPNLVQKNYVIFQQFIPNAKYDLRIIIIHNDFFGYYRFPEKKDFRASGSGHVTKTSIPQDVLLLAKRIKDSMPKSKMLAIDFLFDETTNLHLVIESSIFIKIETSQQLMIDNIAGRYKYIEKDNNFIFIPGNVWLQELVLIELLKEYAAIE